MGRGAAPAHGRSVWMGQSHLLLMAFLVSLSRVTANYCPEYCTCNVTLHFFHVSCEGASLAEVPQRLPSKATTTLLLLRSNRITILRENSLLGYHQLQLLNVEYNRLEQIDEKAFHNSPELRVLKLGHNNLRNLDPDLFVKNAGLKFVDLSNNRLILPRNGPFLKSASLVILNLTDANLSEIPVNAFSEMRGLQQLELTNNLLKTVALESLSVFANRNVTVLMWGNPLRCDCELKRTWEWVTAHAPSVARKEALCDQPKDMRGRPWFDMRVLSCGGGGSAAGTYALYAIAGLLVVIAVLVGLVVWAVRRRRRKRNAAAAKGGAGVERRPKNRLAPPVGEYIEVIDDKKDPRSIGKEQHSLMQMEPVYDALTTDARKEPRAQDDPGKRDLSGELRYVPSVSRITYVPPVPVFRDEGPIYVNMQGPPLPLRRPSDVPPPPTGPPPPVPAAHDHAPPPAKARPCSIPLLEGCDFYEVAD